MGVEVWKYYLQEMASSHSLMHAFIPQNVQV